MAVEWLKYSVIMWGIWFGGWEMSLFMFMDMKRQATEKICVFDTKFLVTDPDLGSCPQSVTPRGPQP